MRKYQRANQVLGTGRHKRKIERELQRTEFSFAVFSAVFFRRKQSICTHKTEGFVDKDRRKCFNEELKSTNRTLNRTENLPVLYQKFCLLKHRMLLTRGRGEVLNRDLGLKGGVCYENTCKHKIRSIPEQEAIDKRSMPRMRSECNWYSRGQ